ncbi:hypothetical protein CsSME_00001406 [Camellia sinensis var. sinensis]
MDAFLKKFFPDVYTKMKEDTTVSNYCKFNNQLLTLFISSLYVASLIASFVASPVTRTFGRRLSMLVGGAAYLAGAALASSASNVFILILGRVMLGVGIGFSNQVGSRRVNVSHLQFADDTLFLCKADWAEIEAMKRVLRCFEIVSGLRINFHKSVVCGVGVDDELVKEFVAKLNCLGQKLPLKYLGLPLGANPSRRQTWQPVIDKVKLKLAGWKRRLLSFAGRLVLIKSVLSKLPTYYMSLFKIPESVAKDINRLQAAFLWGDTELRRKVHLVDLCGRKNSLLCSECCMVGVQLELLHCCDWLFAAGFVTEVHPLLIWFHSLL